jgi:hypothetical protein
MRSVTHRRRSSRHVLLAACATCAPVPAAADAAAGTVKGNRIVVIGEAVGSPPGRPSPPRLRWDGGGPIAVARRATGPGFVDRP